MQVYLGRFFGGDSVLGMSDARNMRARNLQEILMCDEHEKVYLCASEDFLRWLRVSDGFHGVMDGHKEKGNGGI